MNSSNTKPAVIIAALEAVAAVFLILAVTVIAPVCTEMLELVSGKQVFMKCHYTSLVILFLGILLLINAVLQLISKQNMVCGVMTIALAVFVFVALSAIGVCANAEMACNLTASFAKVSAGAAVILGAVSVFFGLKQR